MGETGAKSDGLSKKVIMDELSKIEASDIMVFRSHVVILNADSPFPEIIETVTRDGHSRFPVFSETIDNIIGILYVKDLLNLCKNPKMVEKFNIQSILRKPLFISENKKASELLAEFRKTHIHMAIVVDEYGTMLGIITLEDVLEEIVGEISDEFDKEEDSNLMMVNPREYIILPRMTIEEFNKVFKTKIQSEDFETIGGFIVDQFGYVPKVGESIDFSNFHITIDNAEGSKINSIRVKRT